MKYVLLISILLSSALLARAALPCNSSEGKKLHDAHCMKCHNTSIYTRQDRQIKSLDALNERVGACLHMAQSTLTDTEQASVVKYLNEQFYKLK